MQGYSTNSMQVEDSNCKQLRTCISVLEGGGRAVLLIKPGTLSAPATQCDGSVILAEGGEELMLSRMSMLWIVCDTPGKPAHSPCERCKCSTRHRATRLGVELLGNLSDR